MLVDFFFFNLAAKPIQKEWQGKVLFNTLTSLPRSLPLPFSMDSFYGRRDSSGYYNGDDGKSKTTRELLQ